MTDEQRARANWLMEALYDLAVSLGWRWDRERQEWVVPLQEGEDGTAGMARG